MTGDNEIISSRKQRKRPRRKDLRNVWKRLNKHLKKKKSDGNRDIETGSGLQRQKS